VRCDSGGLLLLALLVSASQHAQAKVPNASLCHAPEVTYFSCQTTAKKIISLCGNGSNSLQYRFGKPRALELQFPKDSADGAKQFKYSHYFRPQTDYWELRFANSDVNYTVFERWADGQKSAGVEVRLANAKEGDEKQIACVGKFSSKLDALKSTVPCDADSALNMGSCPAK
jgi:hypothetical protein